MGDNSERRIVPGAIESKREEKRVVTKTTSVSSHNKESSLLVIVPIIGVIVAFAVSFAPFVVVFAFPTATNKTHVNRTVSRVNRTLYSSYFLSFAWPRAQNIRLKGRITLARVSTTTQSHFLFHRALITQRLDLSRSSSSESSRLRWMHCAVQRSDLVHSSNRKSRVEKTTPKPAKFKMSRFQRM